MKMKMESDRKLSGWVVYFRLTLLWGLLHKVPSMALEKQETYIIHMDPFHKPSPFSTHEMWHQVILDSLSSSSIFASSLGGRSERLIYSYNHALHGFSAKLTPSELKEVEKLPAHRSTLRERHGKLSTTRSPSFLGLNYTSGLWPAASYGQDIIIGVLDTGVWPESKSYNDREYGPIPSRWKGECERGASFNSSMCNLKLIGARSFSKGFKAQIGRNISKENDYDSPRDFDGHGTHTASIAAGSSMSNASYFGYARGIARGVAPFARLAIYKVAWFNDFVASDVLAGFDKAIADGVDIISVSLSFEFMNLYEDPIAIGAFNAVKNGIFVACSAGNDGRRYFIRNGAPWIITVGASSIDRSFSAKFIMGENILHMKGTSSYPSSVLITNTSLYYMKNDSKKAQCLLSSLQPAKVQGKVLLCNLMNTQTNIFGSIEEVKRTRAKAAIFLMNMNKNILSPNDYDVPIVVITNKMDAEMVMHYIMNETNSLMVKELRFGLTDVGTTPAPRVAHFSSRGPVINTPSILKPDILAPGIDILAAWVPNRPFITIDGKNMTTDYALVSGTSMATPHIAGVAALLKSVHPDWTPAAIRSAIMTTARFIDNDFSTITDERTNFPATPLDFGAGLVNPSAAVDPGLIYDMELIDYGKFLCTLGYKKSQMEIFTGLSEWNCNKSSADLNYPSFMAVFSKDNVTAGSQMVKTFKRVVTNVGNDKTTYSASIVHDPGMTMRVQPSTIKFNRRNQKIGFTLTVELNLKTLNLSSHPVPNGVLYWVSVPRIHIVSSPVVAILYEG